MTKRVARHAQNFDNPVVEPGSRLGGKQAQRFSTISSGGCHDGHFAADWEVGRATHSTRTTPPPQLPGFPENPSNRHHESARNVSTDPGRKAIRTAFDILSFTKNS